ncbi:MAG: P-type conjugative transfer protein TrbL, partial [Gammaproteobacteria bacterium]|nr:P-type conjugative transfer protein TrbL [Gammaproteobacteria bacterium]
QLGAGAAVGTALGVGIAGAGAARLAAAGVSTAVSAGRAAVSAAARVSGGAATAYGLSQAASGTSGLQGAAAGMAGVARAGGGAAMQAATAPVKNAMENVTENAKAGAQTAWRATGGSPVGEGGAAAADQSAEPPWAKQLRRRQHTQDATRTAAHTIRDGDRPGSPANPSLKDED